MQYIAQAGQVDEELGLHALLSKTSCQFWKKDNAATLLLSICYLRHLLRMESF